MGRFEQGALGLVGAAVLALVTDALFKGYGLVGAIAGALLGYYFGRQVK